MMPIRWGFARLTAVAGTTAVLAAGISALGVAPGTASPTVTYTSDCTYFVSQGTTSVDFAAIGGKGGAVGGAVGGNGGMVSGTVDTTSITSIAITIGGPGSDAPGGGSTGGAGGTSSGFGSGAAGGAGNSFVGQGGGGGGAATLLRSNDSSPLLIGAGGGGAGYGNDGGIGGGGRANHCGQGGVGNGTALGRNGGGGGGAVLNTPGTGGLKAPNAITGNGTSGFNNGGVGGANTGTGGTTGGGGGGGGNQGGGGGGASATAGASGGGGGGASLYFGGLITNVGYGSSALSGRATASVDSAPSAPTGVSAAAVGTDGASISWTAPVNTTYCNGTTNPPNSYKIEQSTDGGGAWSTVDASTTTNPYSLSSLGRGSYQFRVSANNSVGTGPAATAAQTVVVPGIAQTITFPVIADAAVNAGPVAAAATASSGLPIAYTSSTASTCSVAGSSITLLATGTCTVDANQDGDATYDPASQVSRSFAITAVPTPSGNLAQTPTGPCTGLVPPIRVKVRGLTNVLPIGGCTTNANQRVHVRATARQTRLSTRGDVQWFTIIKKKNGRVLIRTYGQRIKLTITLWAPATSAYNAYAGTRTYKLR